MQVAFRGVRAGLLLFMASWTALATVGCAGRSLKEMPSKSVDLSGEWHLNTALSDDVQKVVQAQLRIMNERMDRERGPQHMGPMRRPTEGMTRNTGRDAADDSSQSEEERDPGGMGKIRKQRDERFSSMVEAPARMNISLQGTRFVVKHDDTSDTYTAGSKSVVSFGRDVADRVSGWNGTEFIVSTRGVEGGSKEERYVLQPDGRLALVTKLSGDRMPEIEIKRIYDRNKS
jgi:hypothetical protein